MTVGNSLAQLPHIMYIAAARDKSLFSTNVLINTVPQRWQTVGQLDIEIIPFFISC